MQGTLMILGAFFIDPQSDDRMSWRHPDVQDRCESPANVHQERSTCLK